MLIKFLPCIIEPSLMAVKKILIVDFLDYVKGQVFVSLLANSHGNCFIHGISVACISRLHMAETCVVRVCVCMYISTRTPTCINTGDDLLRAEEQRSASAVLWLRGRRQPSRRVSGTSAHTRHHANIYPTFCTHMCDTTFLYAMLVRIHVCKHACMCVWHMYMNTCCSLCICMIYACL
jgi:hypothetical protein